MMEGIDLKNREKALEKASEHLKLASALIYTSASGVKPFRVSKILNIMGKALFDDFVVLQVLLGKRDPKKWKPEIRTHAVTLLLTELEERA